MPYLKCVDEDEAKYILEEIHEEFAGTMLALDPSEQGHSNRLFLAYYAGGRSRARQEV